MKTRTLPAPTAGLAIAALVAAAASIATFGVVVAHIAASRYNSTGDFLSFFTAGFLARTGASAHLYDPSVTEATQHLLYPHGFDTPIAYPLPVFVAWLFAPLSWLPFRAAYFLYMSVTAGLLVGVLAVLSRWLGGLPRRLRWLFLLCSGLAMPSLATIVFGQVDLIVLAGLAGGYMLLQAKRRTLAGLALCAVLVKPHLLIGVVLLLLARREWRALGALAGVGLPLLVVPALIAGPSTLIANARAMAFLDQHFIAGARVGTMPTWRGFIDSLTNSDRLVYWAPGYLAIAAGAITIALSRWRAAVPFDRDYSIAVLLALVVSPHLHSQSLVVVLLPAALALRAYVEPPTDTAMRLRAANAILLGFTLLFVLPFMAIQGLSLTVFLVLAGYLAVSFRWPAQGRIVVSREEDDAELEARAA